nr:retinol dehydrogenase 7-like isoform X2 [Pogona vitticeps]
MDRYNSGQLDSITDSLKHKPFQSLCSNKRKPRIFRFPNDSSDVRFGPDLDSKCRQPNQIQGLLHNPSLWGLVNNAGVAFATAPNEWLKKGDFENVIHVNLLGVIDVTLHMLPLVRRARGRVVNVASVMGRLASFGGGYCPSKYGVEAFSDSLRRELFPFGVQVSIIEPGNFSTPIAQKIRESFKAAWSRAPSDAGAAYGQLYFEEFCRLLQELGNRGCPNLHLVTDKIEHALTSCHPRTRYSAGWDAKLFYLPVSYLPTSLADYVLTRSLPRPAQAV